jgi:SAM-dependent methyltransferase
VNANQPPGILLLRGDAGRLPLREESVDLIVTSPPYYHVRDYGYTGQLGLEATPLAYLEALWAATREMVRVLKPTGSIWINLGDCYQAAPQGPDRSTSTLQGRANLRQRTAAHGRILRAKSLHGLPWAYALGCSGMLRHLNSGMVSVELARALLRDVAQGWLSLADAEAQLDLVERVGGLDTGLKLILRRDQIWAKTNPIPESVRDRPYTTHEYWFLLTKSERYYAAVDLLREPYSPNSFDRDRYGYGTTRFGARNGPAEVIDGGMNAYHGATHPLGRMPGSVWRLPIERLPQTGHLAAEHYAAFGTEWPRRLILGWSPPTVCKACGQGGFPVTDRELMSQADASAERSHDHDRLDPSNGWGSVPRDFTSTRIVGYACGCTPFTDHPGTGRATRRRSYSPGLRDNNAQGTYGRHQVGEYERVGPWREYHLAQWKPPPSHPAVVLDPFSGTGTVAHVAAALERVGIGIDLSEDYCRMAADRELAAIRTAKVLGVDKMPGVAAVRAERQGQLGLFKDGLADRVRPAGR